MKEPGQVQGSGNGLLSFFVYSNLFIAVCAALMVTQTYAMVLREKPDVNFIGFAFFSTICSYSFHWQLTPDMDSDSHRLRWLKKYRYIHMALFLAGLAGAAWFGYELIRHWQLLLLAAFVTFLYSAPKIPHPLFRALRKVALGKTIFLAFVWMYVTTLMPLQLSNQAWQTHFTLFAASRFFFIYAICVLFDYRDREYDKSIGIRSLITWLSEKAIFYVFIISLVISVSLAILLRQYGYDAILIVALVVPALVTGLLYRYATTHFSDMLYYFVLDGLMALSSIIILIPGI